MRVRDKGGTFGVYVSARDVSNWNYQWPGSVLDGKQYFEFDKASGDLIDHEGQDGPEAVALSHDAQEYGCMKLGLKNPHK